MSKNIAFDTTKLFNKAKLYVERALQESREDNVLFPFWLSLSLEFLARSTLAHISPMLLAEVSNGDSTHLFYALGYSSTDKPKSIPMRLVLERLTKMDINFTKKEQEICLSIVEQRNTELHSGMVGYEKFPAHLWLGEYYRICKIFLQAQDFTLTDFLGKNEAAAAQTTIDSEEKVIKKRVLDRISRHAKNFFKLKPEIQKKKKDNILEQLIIEQTDGSKSLKCPSCQIDAALLIGQFISVSNPKLYDKEIQRERRYLPKQLRCLVCGLKINSLAELKAAGLGSQFTEIDHLDPVEYHGIDMADLVEYEPDYMDE